MQDQPSKYRWLHVAAAWVYYIYALLLFVQIGVLFIDAAYAVKLITVAGVLLSAAVGYLLAKVAFKSYARSMNTRI